MRHRTTVRARLTYRFLSFVPTVRLLAGRLAVLSLSAALALTLATAPLASAYGADGESEQSAEAPASVPESSEAAAPADVPSSDATDEAASSASAPASSTSSAAASKEESAEEKKRKEKEEAAAKKHAEADAIFAQIGSLDSSYSSARADKETAERERDDAIAARDDAKERLKGETERLKKLETELSDYVVGMYKQGGMPPYLDAVLRSTTYGELLTSWNAMNIVGNRGAELASEMRKLQLKIKQELDGKEKAVKDAERKARLADIKSKQIVATQEALAVQAWNTKAEAHEILDEKAEAENARNEANNAKAALDRAIAEGLGGENVQSGNGVFAYPCPGSIVSSGFGYRDFDHSVHKGIDMAAPEGTPYYAADSGVVIDATNGGGDNGGAGNWIVIDHGDGVVTKYMHSLITFVSVGDHVERGQNIGLVGSTGNSTGPHLHFQVEVYGAAIDPSAFL